MRRFQNYVYLFLILSLFWCFSARADELFYAEAEVERGEEISRISIFIINNADLALEIYTDSFGGPGCYDDRVTKCIGTGVYALPELTFEKENGWVTVRAPYLGGGQTRRDMKPDVFVVPPKTRKQYYSFLVPTLHMQGRFNAGKIVFPDANEVRPHWSRGTKELVIGITDLLEKNSVQENSE